MCNRITYSYKAALFSETFQVARRHQRWLLQGIRMSPDVFVGY